MDELLADEQRARDTRPDARYSEADSLRAKANLLVQMLILLGISFWFFTLAQIVDHKVKYLFAAFGGFLLLAGSFAALAIELVM